MKRTLFAACFLLQASEGFVPRAPLTTTAVPSMDLTLKVTTGLDTVGAPKQETTVAAVPKVAQRWRKSTKQLVTLGPASSSREMIEKLFLAGADLFRLNFSHGSQEQKKELLMTIREIEEKYAHPIGILGDLQGPKLRVSHCSRISRSLACVILRIYCQRLVNSRVRTERCLRWVNPSVSTWTQPKAIAQESCFLIRKLSRRQRSGIL